MDLQISLTLDNTQKAALTRALRTTNTNLQSRLEAYAKAAAEEYVLMFLGQKVFSRGSDILEHRLFLMIKFALDGVIPDEQLVSALFQCTHSQSRALLRSVMAKYRFQLLTTDALKAVLDTIRKDRDGEHYLITITQEAILSELNSILAVADGSLIQITKKLGTSTEYEIRKSSYNKICENLGIAKKLSPPMVDTIAGDTLLVAILTILYAVWYSQIEQGIAITVLPGQEADHEKNYRVYRSVFFWKALPIALCSIALVAINSQECYEILRFACSQIGLPSPAKFDSSKATFVLVTVVMAFLAGHAIRSVILLGLNVNKMKPK